MYKDGEEVGIGRCVGTVQTMPERLLGWMFHIGSDYDKAKHVKSNGPNKEQYPNYEIARINDHHQITYSCRKLPFPLVARDWLQRGIFTQVGDDKFVLVFKFIVEATTGVPRIRGEAMFLCIFERLPHNCCKFTYIVKADIKGSVPKIGLSRNC